MHRRFPLLSLAILVVTLVACDDPETAYVRGRIVDSSGNPIAHAWVLADFSWYGCCDSGHCGGQLQKCGKTNARGHFEVNATQRRCEPGAYASGIWAQGFKAGFDYTPSDALDNFEQNMAGTFTLFSCDEAGGSGPCRDTVRDASFEWCEDGTPYEPWED